MKTPVSQHRSVGYIFFHPFIVFCNHVPDISIILPSSIILSILKQPYSAHKEDVSHHKTVRATHKGIRKTPAKLREIEAIFSPLITKGQSLNHICTTHEEQLGVRERTIYNYIDKNVFKVRNIDLPKKIVYRKRRSKKTLPDLNTHIDMGEHTKISLRSIIISIYFILQLLFHLKNQKHLVHF